MKVFKKGDKVMVNINGANASQFNDENIIHPTGVYGYKHWEDEVFEIEGSLQLCNYDHDNTIFGAYLLTLNGVNAGYVYNRAVSIYKPTKVELTKSAIYEANSDAFDLQEDISLNGVWFKIPNENYKCFFPLIG